MELRLHSARTVFVLGAGASAGSGYGVLQADNKVISPPTDFNFWAEIQNYPGLRNIKKDNLDLLRQMLKLSSPDLGLEEVWNVLAIHKKYVFQNFVNYPEQIKQQIAVREGVQDWVMKRSYTAEHALAVQAEIELMRLLTHAFGRSLKPIPNGKSSYTETVERIQPVLTNNEKCSFLTFNYDCTLEHALSLLGKDFYYPNFELFEPSHPQCFPVIKLHGSLNWKHGQDGFIRPRLRRNGGVVIQAQDVESSIFEPGEVGDSRAPSSLKKIEDWLPMIVPPILFKEELFFNTGQERVRTHFELIWKMALEMVQQADQLIFIGYSFPAADPHARWLFTMRRPDARILYVGHSSDREKMGRIERILGATPKFCFCGFQNASSCIKAILAHDEEFVCPTLKGMEHANN